MVNLYARSIENSYQLLSGKATLDQILSYLTYLVIDPNKEFPEDVLPVFFIEPGEKPTEEEIDEMITYFEKQEDYEKCQYLKEFKQKL